MQRRVLPLLGALLIFTTLLAGSARAAGSWTVVHAHHGPLLLTLRVKETGGEVVARASLTNTGTQPWSYRGGCAPPIAQIQAIDDAGVHVYGWVPSKIECMAIALLNLPPGASIRTRARFAIAGTVHVFAAVPSGFPGHFMFRTKAISVPAH